MLDISIFYLGQNPRVMWLGHPTIGAEDFALVVNRILSYPAAS